MTNKDMLERLVTWANLRDEIRALIIDGSLLDINLLFGDKCNDEIIGSGSGIDLFFGNSGQDIIKGAGGLINILFGNIGNDGILRYMRVANRGELFMMSGFVGKQWTAVINTITE